jgi:hypothetical protein
MVVVVYARYGGKGMVGPSSGTEPYCAYSHFSSMLERTDGDWFLAMFEVYFDDSGTDLESDIAIAACYVSTKRGWDEFTREWKQAAYEEGFTTFHMAEFVAPNKHGHKPWCDWDNQKKDRVYNRLAKIINENKRAGIACAVPKLSYGTLRRETHEAYGYQHYTFAVRMCLSQVIEWRAKSLITLPMQYIFDWEMHASPKRREIQVIFSTLHESWEPHLGTGKDGCSFQHREEFRPLQAADVLAWQMNSHMRKIFPLGQDDTNLCHPGFMTLRKDQEMNLGFFTEDQLRKFQEQFEQSEELRRKLGK